MKILEGEYEKNRFFCRCQSWIDICHSCEFFVVVLLCCYCLLEGKRLGVVGNFLNNELERLLRL